MAARRKVLGVAVAVAACLVSGSLLDSEGLRRYFDVQRQVAAAEERNARLDAEIAALRQEVRALRTDRPTQERAVREELGFVAPGELVFVEVP